MHLQFQVYSVALNPESRHVRQADDETTTLMTVDVMFEQCSHDIIQAQTLLIALHNVIIRELVQRMKDQLEDGRAQSVELRGD